jgi:CTP synthase
MNSKDTKYIFVTGGVVSSLGKGIVASSLGRLLISRGLKCTIQKFDPYINIDPGTLNPYEHGECFVTDDGYEADLDLGHYERFLDIKTSRNNNVTTGRVYMNVITRERRGDFLGKTVQVVPHITDEIKRCVKRLAKDDDYDIIITEIGGTVGDIESLPFLEAVRQLKWELGDENCMVIHLTYVPYLRAAKELKTKPTQHSVKALQEEGIQPDMLVLRSEMKLEEDLLKKVALFCNVPKEAVIQSYDCPSIYMIPLLLQEQKMDEAVLRQLGLPIGPAPKLEEWRHYLDLAEEAKKYEPVKIGLVGKYVSLQDAYKSIDEAIHQSGVYNGRLVDLVRISSDDLTDETAEQLLSPCDAVVIAPGFGSRGIPGKIAAIRYCREHDVPTLGICLGMQCICVEFAQHVLGLEHASSTEFDSQTPDPVIDLMEEQKEVTALGGTMRLGGYACELEPESKAAEIYGTTTIRERHRHRYEFNSAYEDAFREAGVRIAGRNPDTGLVEVVELPEKQWFIGVQYHPEYSSTLVHTHPLFMSLVKQALKHSEAREQGGAE